MKRTTRLTPELKERLFAGRVPGQALTKEQWEALGGNDPDKRPLTQDPIGAHPHPKTGSPE